jgi:hypothetical protein
VEKLHGNSGGGWITTKVWKQGGPERLGPAPVPSQLLMQKAIVERDKIASSVLWAQCAVNRR